jgi:general secretion pathway protein D
MESQIVTMLNELDRPPPQVMIQVLLAEVSLSDRFEMGMEFSFQDLTFSESAYVGNNGVIQGSGYDFIGGTDLGAAGSGLGGVSFTITGEDFNFLVRALQVEGRLQILSRPALLVQDNKEASINVGERVPIVKDLVVTGTGLAQPSVDYEDVGIKLQVTPQINPDGFVAMEIAPEISSLATSSVSIGSGITLPIINSRTAKTNVTVKDGETIIIGGLITSTVNESENKVPVLGDVPLVGLAFRSSVRTTLKTELLLVLTPHVVHNPDDARTISVQMRDQTGVLDDARTSPLMQGLQVKPDEDKLAPDEKPGNMNPNEKPQQQEMGPTIEELGPPTTSIEFGPDRNSMAIAK